MSTRFTILLAALSLGAVTLSCSPEYRSGETVCATTAPQCPDGFYCSGIRCYKLGDRPPNSDRADSGTAGAGGSAGGAGGNAGGTTGGSAAGTGGATGGRGGASGTGGSGAGGSGMPGAMARVKFCNNMAGSAPIQATIGPLTLTASAGQCSPAAPQACAAIPSGTVALKLVQNGQTAYEGTEMVTAGVDYMLITFFNQENEPSFEFNPLSTVFEGEKDCAAFVLPPNPGTGGAGGAGGVGGSGGTGGSGGAGGSSGGTCTGATPVSCPGISACFPAGTVCSTVVQCGTMYRSCTTAAMVNDCGTTQCTLPASTCISTDTTLSEGTRCILRKCCSYVAACLANTECKAQVDMRVTTHPLWQAVVTCGQTYCR